MLPSVVVALIVVVPTPTDVIKPLLSTVATDDLLLVQFKDGFDASLGMIVAINCAVSGNVKVKLLSFSVILCTYFFTVTCHSAVRFVPSVVLAVIVASPGDIELTSPLSETDATSALLDSQVTVL